MRGNVFLHPPLRFAIEFPQGWEITNSDEQVVAQEPGNKVFMVLRTIEPRPGRSLDQAAQQHMRESGYKATDVTSATIGGMQAVVGTYEGNASGIGKVTARGAHVAARPQHVLHRRHRAAGHVPARVAAISIGRFSRSGR